MIRYQLLKILLLFIIITFGTMKTYSYGLGFYGTASLGESEFNYFDEYYYENDNLFTANVLSYGIGAVYDTKIAKKGLFNYRLQVGLEFITYEDESTENLGNNSNFGITNKIENARATIDNVFGFGLYSNKEMRFWVGPTLRMAFQYDMEHEEMVGFGVGGGGVIGTNWHVDKDFSVSIEAGFRITSYNGTYYIERYYQNGKQTISMSYSNSDEDFYAKVSMIYRFNDEYSKK